LHARADEDLRVPAADAGEPEHAVVVDVRDDQPDLVDVADDRGQRAAVTALHDGDARAHEIAAHVRAEALRRLAPDARRGLLVARRSRGGQQRAQGLGGGHRGKTNVEAAWATVTTTTITASPRRPTGGGSSSRPRCWPASRSTWPRRGCSPAPTGAASTSRAPSSTS